MNAVEFWAIVALAAVLIAYIAKCARDEKKQAAWDDHIESIVTDTTLYPDVDRSEDLAAYEAARVDWTEPNRWGA